MTNRVRINGSPLDMYVVWHGIASDRQMFNKLKKWVNWIKATKTIGMILSYPPHSVLISTTITTTYDWIEVAYTKTRE